MVQLQTQVQQLQDSMTQMKQSFDERMGVMKNLIEQTTDNVNRLNSNVDNLTKTLQQQSGDSGAKTDSKPDSKSESKPASKPAVTAD